MYGNWRTGAKQTLMVTSEHPIENCTFIGNAVVKDGNWQSALVCNKGSCLYNCLFKDNSCNRETGTDGKSPMYCTNCLYEVSLSGYNGECRKLTADDIFEFKGGDDLWTKYDIVNRKAPTCDKGISREWHATGVDILGRPRTVARGVDIGCYENQLPTPGLMLLVR